VLLKIGPANDRTSDSDIMILAGFRWMMKRPWAGALFGAPNLGNSELMNSDQRELPNRKLSIANGLIKMELGLGQMMDAASGEVHFPYRALMTFLSHRCL